MSITHAANPGRHSIVARKDDLYETPAEAVRALLRAESLPDSVWEPACGPGSIVGILRATGHRVYATDLVDYGCPDSENGVDFLMERPPCFSVGAIVTNPPYKLADQCAHALSSRGYAPALGLPGKPTPLRSGRWRLTGAGACLSKPAANDAPARLAGSARIKFDYFCLVCLGPRPPRQDRTGPDMTCRTCSEQQIHRAVVQHLRQRGVPGLVFLHPANGGARKPVEAAIFQSLGVRAGASDLLLWYANRSFALELKAPGGRPTRHKRQFLADMKAAGAHVAVAMGLDAALRTLEGWSLLRGRVL